MEGRFDIHLIGKEASIKHNVEDNKDKAYIRSIKLSRKIENFPIT